MGYVTLVNHLSYTLKEIGSARRTELQRWSPQRIRRQLLDEDFDAMIVVDAHNEASSFDVEKGAAVLLPHNAHPAGQTLTHVGSLPDFDVYRAASCGSATVTGLNDSFAIRVMPKAYEGAAANRFLEDPDEQKTDAQPRTIVADNLSLGWARAMLELTRPGVTRITPMTLIIRGFNTDGAPVEVPKIWHAVDAFLRS